MPPVDGAIKRGERREGERGTGRESSRFRNTGLRAGVTVVTVVAAASTPTLQSW